MSSLLYIQASPRGERSHCIAVADAFIQAYKQKHPDDDIVTVNVFDASIPSFDGLAVQAKYTILHGQSHSKEQQQAWKNIEKVIDQFTSADKYVLAVPMWNFSIPYRLKQYIDILVQPGYTFSYMQRVVTRVSLPQSRCWLSMQGEASIQSVRKPKPLTCKKNIWS